MTVTMAQEAILLLMNTANNKRPPKQQIKRTFFHKPHHRAADPIKDEQDIQKAKEWFLNQPQRYTNNHLNLRNYLLFIIGINCGRRISDTRDMKIGDFVNPNGTYKKYLEIKEHKTGKPIQIYINESVKEALSKYLTTLKNKSLDDYLFQSRTKTYTYNGKVKTDSRLTPERVNQIYKKMADDIGLTDKGVHFTTHGTRKTTAYRMIKSNPTDTRTLINVQKFLNHSSFDITLRYVGIQQEEIDDLTKAISI